MVVERSVVFGFSRFNDPLIALKSLKTFNSCMKVVQVVILGIKFSQNCKYKFQVLSALATF
jgi:hypothetical protein